jgi:hypothetical protein
MTDEQRREAYTSVLDTLLGWQACSPYPSPPVYVCVHLDHYADAHGWFVKFRTEDDWPEFFAQKPDGRHRNQTWWPRRQLQPRIDALEAALALLDQKQGLSGAGALANPLPGEKRPETGS